MKADYVLGFIFNRTKTEVVLIEKNRPAWQMGKLNGIGGHIEENELPIAAMRRECAEETGFAGDLAWRCFAIMGRDDKIPRFRCHCFVAIAPVDMLTYLALYSHEDQNVAIYATSHLPLNCLSNLYWLIPMAADEDVADGCPYTTIATIGISRERAAACVMEGGQ